MRDIFHQGRLSKNEGRGDKKLSAKQHDGLDLFRETSRKSIVWEGKVRKKNRGDIDIMPATERSTSSAGYAHSSFG